MAVNQIKFTDIFPILLHGNSQAFIHGELLCPKGALQIMFDEARRFPDVVMVAKDAMVTAVFMELRF